MKHSGSRVLTWIGKWTAIFGIMSLCSVATADTTLTIVFNDNGTPKSVSVDKYELKSCGTVADGPLSTKCGGKHPVDPLNLWSISYFRGLGSTCGWVNINGFLFWMCK